MRVLLLEDDLLLRRIIMKCLSSLDGIHVHGEPQLTPASAVDRLLADFDPAVIVSDDGEDRGIGSNGFAISLTSGRRYRERIRPDLKIWVLSGKKRVLEDVYRQEGADRVLDKDHVTLRVLEELVTAYRQRIVTGSVV